jgi:hypothetical protein
MEAAEGTEAPVRWGFPVRRFLFFTTMSGWELDKGRVYRLREKDRKTETECLYDGPFAAAESQRAALS